MKQRITRNWLAALTRDQIPTKSAALQSTGLKFCLFFLFLHHTLFARGGGLLISSSYLSRSVHHNLSNIWRRTIVYKKYRWLWLDWGKHDSTSNWRVTVRVMVKQRDARRIIRTVKTKRQARVTTGRYYMAGVNTEQHINCTWVTITESHKNACL